MAITFAPGTGVPHDRRLYVAEFLGSVPSNGPAVSDIPKILLMKIPKEKKNLWVDAGSGAAPVIKCSQSCKPWVCFLRFNGEIYQVSF